jgi:TolB-like protein/Tfp pilus assembly protein PilF
MEGTRAVLKVKLLGSFECLWGEDEVVEVQSKKARGVLAYLALARGKSVLREQLAGVFWPSSAEQQARQSLRQCLSSLRKLFDDSEHDLILSEGGQVGLNPERVEVDVDCILTALATDEEHQNLRGAGCAQGQFLQDHVFGEASIDDWVRDERVRLQAACRRLLFRRVEELEKKGEDEQALENYWRLLALDPPCEEAHRGLMETYARLGQRSSALAQYQACEDALARHMDARPSEATRAFFEKLRQSDEDFEARQTPTLPLPDKPAIAVLAFDNLSADPGNEYLCDGISEDITTFLSQFSSLYVISRRTAFTFKGSGLPISEIGRQLGVHYVLEGSVRLAGNRIRVAAQLIEAEQGGHVWSNRYEGTMDDIFAFQDDISQRIVATTAGRIEAKALDRARRKASSDLDAYDCVLRGKHHHHRCTPEDSEIAVEMFQKALERKPDYPLAQGWLTCAMGRAAGFGKSRAKWMNSNSYGDFMNAELKTVQAAEAVDDEESECLRLIGEVHLFNRDYEKAEGYFRRAHAFNPNDDRILSQLSAFWTYCNEAEDAVRYARLAIRLNPYHPGFYSFNLGRALMLLERYDEAIVELESATPVRNHYRVFLAASYAALGRDEDAARVRVEILAVEPEFTLEFFKVTMLFRDQSVIEKLLGLMENAGLPRGNC